ncbi:MAG: UDP-3-O-acyl-N-acetylglucosamine deacetylase [Litorivicinus sp.]
MIRQRTLGNVIRATGVGLHSGEKVYLTLRPAPDDKGIVFRRVDLDPVVETPAHALSVSDTQMATRLGTGESSISTVEHFLSAVSALGIDNMIVDVNRPELPIMDGSAAPFVFLIQSAGIREQTSPKKFLRILKPIEVRHPDKFARLQPFDGYRITFEIEYDHPSIPKDQQNISVDISTTGFIREVSRARTYGFMRDIEFLRKNDLAKGGSTDNAIVLGEDGILNEGGLRYANEFVKHKVLDAVGDLALAGHTLIGEMVAKKSGHGLNNDLVRALLADPSAWRIETFNSMADCPVNFAQPSLDL